MVGMLEAASIKLGEGFNRKCVVRSLLCLDVLSRHGGHANLLESREMLVLGDELNVATLTSWRCLSCGLQIHQWRWQTQRKSLSYLIHHFEEDRQGGIWIDTTDFPGICTTQS